MEARNAATPNVAPGDPIRLLLVDDHEHVLWGLRKLIEGEWPRMTVVAAAKSIPEALDAIGTGRIDVVVLDVCLGADDGLDHMAEIKVGGAAVVVLTGSNNVDIHKRAFDVGARTVVLKEEPAQVLLQEIELAYESRIAPELAAAREQDCRSAAKARIAGFILSTKRRWS
jgi:two-component system, NarL family, nitrate/nitrite response regulator NarL